MRHASRRAALAAVLLTGALAACGGSDSTGPVVTTDPGNGTPVGLKGTLASATLSGDIDLTIAGSAITAMPAGSASGSPAGVRATVAVTGCLYLKSATCVAITGTYNTTTKALTLSTASPALTFTGTYVNGVVDGTFTGTGGGGLFSVRTGTITVYCGSFSGAASGRWNFVISGTTLDGVYNDGSGNAQLTGTLTGSTVNITFSGGTAVGAITGASANGQWTAGTSSGNWIGSTAGCRS